MTEDFYIDKETGILVFTKKYHISRGYCCGNGCRHCPFYPRHVKGTTKLSTKEGITH